MANILPFNKWLFLYLFTGFVAVTIIGTLTHEIGHYMAAKWMGYEAYLHYAYAEWRAYPNQATGTSDAFFIALAGPIETMLTGTVGLALLFWYRKSFVASRQPTFRQWAIVFTALFWLRQTVNYCTWIGGYWLTGRFSERPDEIRLARYLALPDWSISFPTAFVGIVVLAVVVFKAVPAHQRLTFLAAGLTGGTTGYVLWLHALGPVLMP